MKKKCFFAGMLVLALVFGMAVIGCDNGSTEPGPQPPQVETFTGAANSETYMLKITDGAAYELTVGSKKSTGSAVKNGGTYTLTPSNGAAAFTVTVSGNDITAMSGTITFNDNSMEDAPAAVAPCPKSITITGLNGKTGKIAVCLFVDRTSGSRTPYKDEQVVQADIAQGNATGRGTLSGDAITVSLKNGGEITDWTGTGSYYLGIYIDNTFYCYVNGGSSWQDWAVFSITEPVTTVAFSTFKFAYTVEPIDRP